VALADELVRIAEAAETSTRDGELVVGVLAAEAATGDRVYLCALGSADNERAWLALDADAVPVTSRQRVRDAVSIAALCEIAEESAFSGDLDELRAQLVQLRLVEAPAGIEEAEVAAARLQHLVGAPPQLATPERLDAIGAAARRLEAVLYDHSDGSPFTVAMQGAQGAVDALWGEVEAGYRGMLE
jgi:predicted small integral membrane protein